MDLVFPTEEQPSRPEPLLKVSRWTLVPKLGRSWFKKEFRGVRWSYVGSNSLTLIDTTFTRELRARLEAEFGTPTQTIADLMDATNIRAGANIQFEYWFVINDTIPLMVMDVNGPFERGLVVASDQKYRGLLMEIKDAFLGRLAQSDSRGRYADYYFLPEQNMWFISGYDGERFFVNRISRPDLKLGRPILPKALHH